MLIRYKTKKLEKQLTNPKELNKRFGQLAKKINQRISQLKAAENLAVMKTIPAARCHELTAAYKGCIAVDVSGNYRLIFTPDHEETPRKEDGGINWDCITIIAILEITDYH